MAWNRITIIVFLIGIVFILSIYMGFELLLGNSISEGQTEKQSAVVETRAVRVRILPTPEGPSDPAAPASANTTSVEPTPVRPCDLDSCRFVGTDQDLASLPTDPETRSGSSPKIVEPVVGPEAQFTSANSEQRAIIIDEIEKREQRVTNITAELFPNMEFDTEHNAFVTVSRGRTGDKSVSVSPRAAQTFKATLEPTIINVVDAATTDQVGAKLIGANFNIEPSKTQWRYIPDGGEDKFSWIVTPKKEGNLQITIVLRNKLSIGDTVLDLPVNEFPRTVTVSVDVWTNIGRTLAGAETAIATAQNVGLTAVGLFGFGSIGAAWAAFNALRRRRKSKVQQDHLQETLPIDGADSKSKPRVEESGQG